jgi:Cu2+-exporting ATPase
LRLQKTKDIQAIIFDKTGTLTRGKFGVSDSITLTDRYKKDDILAYAASVEQYSEHPIAQAIVASTREKYNGHDFVSITGKGVKAEVEGKVVKVVSSGYLKEKNVTVKDNRIDELSEQGKTIVFLLIDEKVKGAIALADIIREESRRAVEKLKNMDIKCMMLTGDREQVARWVADEIGLDEYFAEIMPDEKSKKIEEIQSRGFIVAMTGDGVNDAPALAQADVGIAIGAGTDVALETADVILVKSNPTDVVSVITLARATYKKMVQNLIWATGYNVIAIPLAAGVLYGMGVLLPPSVGAMVMSLSTIIVAINARFLGVNEGKKVNFRK